MRIAASLLCLVATAGASRAEPRRYSRAPAAPDATLSARVKPKPRDTVKPHPEVTGDAVLDSEVRAQPIRVEQESLLLQLVRDTPDTDPDKPEYLFRLAEHYAHQHQLWRLISVRRAME